MSKSSSSFISLPTIIFLVVMYNIFFDDDEEKKDVEVKVDDNPIVSEDLKDGLNDAKEGFKEAIEKAKEAFVKAKDEFIKPDETPMVEEKEQPKEEVIVSKESDDGLMPLDDESEDKDPLFKKLWKEKYVSRNDYFGGNYFY